MKDVSNVFDRYRISVRAIWNTAFWPHADFRNWDSVEKFSEIQIMLFCELVLGKLARKWSSQDIFEDAIPFFRVIPTSDAPIMIQNPRSEKAKGYWDHPLNRINPEDAELHFIAYFDWNRLDYADLRCYRAQIVGFAAHSELVGREALIDRQYATVQIANE